MKKKRTLLLQTAKHFKVTNTQSDFVLDLLQRGAQGFAVMWFCIIFGAVLWKFIF